MLAMVGAESEEMVDSKLTTFAAGAGVGAAGAMDLGIDLMEEREVGRDVTTCDLPTTNGAIPAATDVGMVEEGGALMCLSGVNPGG